MPENEINQQDRDFKAPSDTAEAVEQKQKSRAERIGNDVEKYLDELALVVKTELEGLSPEKQGVTQKIVAGYKKLGEINMHALLEKKGVKVDNKAAKIALRAASLRTVASLGLLGGGLYLGAGSAIGAGAIALRRGMSGLGAGIGSYDFANAMRSKWNRGNAEQTLKEGVTANELFEAMTNLHVRNAFDGKTSEQILDDKLYIQLTEKFEQLLKTEATSATEGTGEYLAKSITEAEKQLRGSRAKEKLARNVTKAGAFGLGAFVGSGILAKLFGNKTSWTSPENTSADLKSAEVPSLDVENLKDLPGSPVETPTPPAVVWENGMPSNLVSPLEGQLPGSNVDVPPGSSEIPPGKIQFEMPTKRPFASLDLANPKPGIQIKPDFQPSVSPEIKPPAGGIAIPEQIEPTKPLASSAEFKMTNKMPLDSLDLKNPKPYEVNLKPDFGVKADFANINPELTPGSAITIEATSKGFEGDLLSLKKTDPARYTKMIDWLKTQPYNHGVSKPGALVHRFMLEYAKENGMSVDAGGKDLSRIFSGEIQIGGDGSIHMGADKIDFMPEKPKLTDLDTSPAETAPEPSNVVEFKTPTKAFNSLDLQNPTPYEPKLNIDLAKVAESQDASDLINDTPRPKARTLAEAREFASGSVEKPSHALQLVVGDEYKKFLKEGFAMSPTNFDKIGKKTISEFLKEYRSKDDTFTDLFHKKYKGLYESLSPKLRLSGSKMTIREYILIAAKNINKKAA